MNINIRKATPNDKDFIITAIIEAEKSGSDVISYCSIFSITESAFRELLGKILDEDIEGQELCISGYLIAEVNNERAAAICGWIEMENGLSSNMIKSNLFEHFLDVDTIINAIPKLQLMGEIDIHREENALQLESTYTAEKFRGLGLYGMLINEHIKLRQEQNVLFNKVQIIILKNNTVPIKALGKLSFLNVKENTCSDNRILEMLPSDTKVLMEKNLNN